jgi:K+-transporting ATPase c subunit
MKSTTPESKPSRGPILTLIFALVLTGLMYLLARSMIGHHFFSGGH